MSIRTRDRWYLATEAGTRARSQPPFEAAFVPWPEDGRRAIDSARASCVTARIENAKQSRSLQEIVMKTLAATEGVIKVSCLVHPRF